jgi:hypothetical protein
MISKLKNGAGFRLCAVSLMVSLSGCASTGTTKTIGSLAGSSAGAVAANAISVAGPWGYVVSIATTALGGFAGNRVASLLGGKGQSDQLNALAKVLEAPQPTALEPFGAQDGKGKGGYAEATGPVFLSNAGANCRSFMLVNYKKKGGLNLDPAAVQNAASAAGDVKSSTEKLSDVNSVGDAVSGAQSAAGAVSNAKDTVAALAPAQAPAAAAPVARPAGTEIFGTACKDKKNIWQVVKSKA